MGKFSSVVVSRMQMELLTSLFLLLCAVIVWLRSSGVSTFKVYKVLQKKGLLSISATASLLIKASSL